MTVTSDRRRSRAAAPVPVSAAADPTGAPACAQWRMWGRVDLPYSTARDRVAGVVVDWLATARTGRRDQELSLTVARTAVGAPVAATRHRLTAPDGISTTVTVADDPDNPGSAWLCVEVHAPADGTGRLRGDAAPPLIRPLLQALPVLDGNVPLRDEAQEINLDGLPDLIQSLQDPDRSAPAIVAYPAEGSGERWRRRAHDMTAGAAGTAHLYLLSVPATAMLVEQSAIEYGAGLGSLRVFAPGARLDSSEDAARHRLVPAATLSAKTATKAAQYVARLGREPWLTLPLPGPLHAADIALDGTGRVLSAGTAPEPPAPVPEPAPPVPEPAPPVPEPEPDPVDREVTALIRDLVGEPVTVAAVQLLRALATTGTATRDREAELAAAVSAAEERAQAAETALTVERREHARTRKNLRAATTKLEELRKRMYAAGLSADIQAVDAAPVVEDAPAGYDDLAVALTDGHQSLPHVVFTGDTSHLAVLADADPHGRWVGRAWDALRALSDYAAVKSAGVFAGGMHHYCMNTPPGSAGWSANQHAAKESDTVGDNPAMRAARTFPVPVEVHQDGAVYMESHFKVANSRLASPRLHYYDDTARSGTVYVGYLGPHLPNTLTN